MKGFLFWILALFFPWVIFILEEKPLLMLFGMAMQVTIIGWLPMSILAVQHRENVPFFAKNAAKPVEKTE